MKSAHSSAVRLTAILCALMLLLQGCSLGRIINHIENETKPNVPINRTDAQAFGMAEDGAVTYPGAIQGIDVSSHQQDIDWLKVRGAGISFAIIQIGFRGYADGSLNVDKRFEENIRAAQNAGLSVGVYFYSQATSIAEAAEEAQFVLDTLGERKLELPVFYDWEEVSKGRTAGYATVQISEYAKTFCSRITDGGYNAGVYFNQKYGYLAFRLSDLKEYAFWLAEYNSYQSFGYEVHFWQYTGKGEIDGISLPVDRDLMYLGYSTSPEDMRSEYGS